jgi:hypothetical protein
VSVVCSTSVARASHSKRLAEGAQEMVWWLFFAWQKRRVLRASTPSDAAQFGVGNRRQTT